MLVKVQRQMDRLLFDAFLFLAFLTLMILALQLQPLAREMPLPIAIIGIVVTFLLLLLDLFPNLQAILNTAFHKQPSQPAKEKEQAEDKEKETEWKYILRIVLWLIVFVVALQWTNFKIATALFVFLVALVEGRVTIRKSILLSAGTTAFFYVLFDLCLNVTF